MKQPIIPTSPVKSSAITEIGHDPATRTLLVKFASGHSYHIADVSPEEHQAFLEADSPGSHYHAHFRGRPVRKAK